ncbi:MAG TPA: TonB-dependent receptor [Phenylobacterium sp.]|nr:TonB-dependent receptor [Phenylobacterium sp.]
MPIIIHALAQAAAAAASLETAAAAPPTQGVISYPAEFFAAARPANASEMVARIPGFSFDGGDSVRGFEGAAGNVLIDGQRPASKTDNLDEILRRIPAAKIAHVDLIRGGAPGIDMQGKSVIANVVLKTGDSFNGLFAVAHNYVVDDGRSGGAMRLEGSGRTGGRSWEAGLFMGRGIDDGAGDGPRVQLGPGGAPQIRSLVQSEGAGSDIVATGAYELPLMGGRLRVNGRFARNNFDYDETNRSSFPADSLALDHKSDDKDTTEIGVRYSRDFGARLKLEMVGLRQSKDELYDEVSDSPGTAQHFIQDSQTGESIARGVLKFTQTPKLSWELGGEGALNTLDNGIRFTENGAAIVLPAANVHVEEKRWEVFGKAVWRPLPKWTVEAALRQEGSEITSSGDVRLEKSLTFTKPRLSVAWDPDARTQLRVRFERVVGQLNFDDFTASSSLGTGVVTTGNPDLNPEQAWVSEAAIERRFWSGGAAVLTVRHSTLTDVIDRAPVFTATGVFDAPANIGEGTKDELIASLTLPFDKIGLRGVLLRLESTWRESEVTDPTTHETREISKLRPQEWEAHFSWDLPQYKLNWGVDAFGAWRQTSYRQDQIAIDKLKAYVQPFIEWKPRTDLSIRAEAGNFTERGFRHTRYVYSGPRSTRGLAFVDDRDIQFGRMAYVRLRKTF